MRKKITETANLWVTNASQYRNSIFIITALIGVVAIFLIGNKNKLHQKEISEKPYLVIQKSSSFTEIGFYTRDLEKVQTIMENLKINSKDVISIYSDACDKANCEMHYRAIVLNYK